MYFGYIDVLVIFILIIGPLSICVYIANKIIRKRTSPGEKVNIFHVILLTLGLFLLECFLLGLYDIIIG